MFTLKIKMVLPNRSVGLTSLITRHRYTILIFMIIKAELSVIHRWATYNDYLRSLPHRLSNRFHTQERLIATAIYNRLLLHLYYNTNSCYCQGFSVQFFGQSREDREVNRFITLCMITTQLTNCLLDHSRTYRNCELQPLLITFIL